MILMGVGEDYTANVRDAKSGTAQALTKSFDGLFCLRPGVDQSDGILGDQITIYRADIKRGGN